MLCSLGIFPSLIGQPTPEKTKPNAFEKKMIMGIAYHQYWSTIHGSSLPENYFSKPSLGISVSVEYYPLSFIGIGACAGYQQRGAGITHYNTLPVSWRIGANYFHYGQHQSKWQADPKSNH